MQKMRNNAKKGKDNLVELICQNDNSIKSYVRLNTIPGTISILLVTYIERKTMLKLI